MVTTTEPHTFIVMLRHFSVFVLSFCHTQIFVSVFFAGAVWCTGMLVCVAFSQDLSGADEVTLRRELDTISELHEVETNNKCKITKTPLKTSSFLIMPCLVWDSEYFFFST